MLNLFAFSNLKFDNDMVAYFMLNVIHMQLYQLEAPNCDMLIQITEKPNSL